MQAAAVPLRSVDIFLFRKLTTQCVFYFVELEMLRKQQSSALSRLRQVRLCVAVVPFDLLTHVVEYFLVRAHRLAHDVVFSVEVVAVVVEEGPSVVEVVVEEGPAGFTPAGVHDVVHEPHSVCEAVFQSLVRMLQHIAMLCQATGASQRPRLRQAKLVVQFLNIGQAYTLAVASFAHFLNLGASEPCFVTTR